MNTFTNSTTDLADSVRHMVDEADHVVHAHPYQAIGVAAALGLLVGLLGNRR